MKEVTNFSESRIKRMLLIITLIYIFIFFILNQDFINAATPSPPDVVNISSNTTKPAVSSKMINISGGYIANVNITATTQNTRWKAFVGHVIGRFTLQDSTGSQIYDWSLITSTGRVYATRNSSSPVWTSINCSNVTTLTEENIKMEHTNPNDNLTATFNITEGAIHGSFISAGRLINNNTCPVLRTYVNNVSQNSNFTEVALYDGVNIIYASLLENDVTGYNGQKFDFQMIVPENGNSTWSGATAYYLYVELD
ncbi:MAG: hypothetical protein QXW97_03770 [Candidatus Pacearchaeota archaeon]